MLLILVLFSGVVGEIPIPTLAAVLIFAAASSLRLGRIDTVIRTGLPSQVAFFATLAATLFLPVTAAVGIGVGLSLLLQVNQEAVDLTVVRLTRRGNRSLVESAAPATLPSREVTVLDVYGSLLFAGARTLQTRLPDPAWIRAARRRAPPPWPHVARRDRGSSSSPTTPSSSTPTAATCFSAVSGPTCSSSCGARTASISGTP